MAKNSTGTHSDRLTHPLLEKLGPLPAAAENIFAYSAKIICGKQTETGCCCVAGARPGVYSTEVNIQNLNLATARVAKFVQPLINNGAVVGREPNFADFTKIAPHQIEIIDLPELGATMDDCCRIAELVLGAAPGGDSALTIAILTILSVSQLSVSAVYTANPLSGDGISIDVEYLRPQLLGIRGK